jgi:hypothetical protein
MRRSPRHRRSGVDHGEAAARAAPGARARFLVRNSGQAAWRLKGLLRVRCFLTQRLNRNCGFVGFAPEEPLRGPILEHRGGKTMKTLKVTTALLCLGLAACGYNNKGYENASYNNESAAYNQSEGNYATGANYSAESANYAGNEATENAGYANEAANNIVNNSY